MAIDAGTAAIAGVIVGQGFGLLVWWLQRRVSRRDRREERMSTQAREAALAMLDRLDEARRFVERFKGKDLPAKSQAHLYEMCHRMEREILLLPDPSLRERLSELEASLWYAEIVAEAADQTLSQVGFLLYKAGGELLGAYLREEPLPSHDSTWYQENVEEYTSIIERLYEPIEGVDEVNDVKEG